VVPTFLRHRDERLHVSECIHGLDEVLCDVCSPKPAPVIPPKEIKARAPRATKVPRSSRPAAPVRAAGASVDKPINVDVHRIFHLTHLKNLVGIAERGALLPDAAGANPEFDLSAPGHRDERRAARLPEIAPDATADAAAAVDDAPADEAPADAEPRTVAHCVPFFATPESRLWADVRTGTPDPRLSADARKSAAADYVILATTVGEVERSAALVLALDEASAPAAPMTGDRDAMRRELRRLVAVEVEEGDDHPLGHIELLAVGQVPVEAITLIGVANSKARDEVKEILHDAGLGIRVAVYPPWFTRE
jgi:hypothetical protein